MRFPLTAALLWLWALSPPLPTHHPAGGSALLLSRLEQFRKWRRLRLPALEERAVRRQPLRLSHERGLVLVGDHPERVLLPSELDVDELAGDVQSVQDCDLMGGGGVPAPPPAASRATKREACRHTINKSMNTLEIHPQQTQPAQPTQHRRERAL